MIKEFSKRDHGSVFEVFSKASGDDVSMKPNDIVFVESGRVKEFWVFLKDGKELLSIFGKLFLFRFNMGDNGLIF